MSELLEMEQELRWQSNDLLQTKTRLQTLLFIIEEDTCRNHVVVMWTLFDQDLVMSKYFKKN